MSFLPPGNLADPGIETMSPALADKYFTAEPTEMSNLILRNECFWGGGGIDMELFKARIKFRIDTVWIK